MDDVARGTLAALGLTGYEIINLGSDRHVTLLDMIRMLEDLIDKKAAIVHEARHPADMPTPEQPSVRREAAWDGNHESASKRAWNKWFIGIG